MFGIRQIVFDKSKHARLCLDLVEINLQFCLIFANDTARVCTSLTLSRWAISATSHTRLREVFSRCPRQRRVVKRFARGHLPTSLHDFSPLAWSANQRAELPRALSLNDSLFEWEGLWTSIWRKFSFVSNRFDLLFCYLCTFCSFHYTWFLVFTAYSDDQLKRKSEVVVNVEIPSSGFWWVLFFGPSVLRAFRKKRLPSEALLLTFLSTSPRVPLRIGKYSHQAGIAAGSLEIWYRWEGEKKRWGEVKRIRIFYSLEVFWVKTKLKK